MSEVSKPKILCVDDEPGVLDSLKRLLKNEFEVLTAENAEQGMEVISSNGDLAIVLSDYRMPGISGIDFLKKVKSSCPGALRAILSGQMDINQVMEAINDTEIHRFILKPWENEYLRLQMLEALQAHKSLEESHRLRHLAITDPVTGLTNHRYFQEKMREQLQIALEDKLQFAVVMIDVDHFKTYNDRYGHPEGDRLLADIADLISKHIHDCGSASRYGGEEFVLILPGMDIVQAQSNAEALRRRIEQHVFSGPLGRRAFITVSLGVSTFPEHGGTPELLISAADRALYQAKRQGRNQTAAALIS